MLLDFEVRVCTRVCAESGKTLDAGEVYFSVLVESEGDTIRRDYAADVWQGPPEQNLGWWRSRMPGKNEKPKLAPTEVMLKLLQSINGKKAEQKFRYVLGLLLVRRRVLRREDARRNDDGDEILMLARLKHDEQYEVLVDEPTEAEAEQIQQKMIRLLYGDADGLIPSPTEEAA